MRRYILALSVLAASISFIVYNYNTSNTLHNIANTYLPTNIFNKTQPTVASNTTTSPNNTSEKESMLSSVKTTMSKTLHNAKITPHRSGARGHGDHGWLNTYHSFSFADWYNPKFNSYGSLRVLNEDRVKANSGFPTHPHRDFEIFSYILSGELTHRDSMLRKGAEGGQSDRFFRMHRGDVQFTTGGTGIAHSEFNEHAADTVHFLQIWAIPWKRGLTPRYHTRHFAEDDKRKGFVPILSPLKAGADASAADEKDAEPAVPGTIPIHADFLMSAAIVPAEATFQYSVGAGGDVVKDPKRKVYVHVPMTKGGKAQIRLDGRDDAILSEGDGAFVDGVSAGDKLSFESVGSVEAEVVVLDTA